MLKVPVARLALVASLLLGAGAAAETVSAPVDEAHGPVDRVVAANYEPLMIEAGGALPGYAVEVLQEAARRAGLRVKVTFLPFQRAMYEVRTGAATLMPALYSGKKRSDEFNWLVEIQRARLRFSTVSDNIDDIETARALRSVVVESGATADVDLTALGFEYLVRVKAPAMSARMLAAGRVDAWFQGERVMADVWRRLALPAPVTIGAVIHEVPVYLVASPTLPPAVGAAYREAVEAMRADGALDVIWRRYGGE